MHWRGKRERNFSSLGAAIDKEGTEDNHSACPQRRSGDEAPALCALKAERRRGSFQVFARNAEAVFRRVTFPQQPDHTAQAGLAAAPLLYQRAIRLIEAADLAFVSNIIARHPSRPCRQHLRTLRPTAPPRFVSKFERRVHGEAATGASASFELN